MALAVCLDGVLDHLDRGSVTTRIVLGDEDAASRLARRAVYSLLLGATVLGAVLLYVVGAVVPAVALSVTAIPIALLLLRSFRRQRTLSVRPTFTRQKMRGPKP
ncbi:MAG: hypothetical protein ACQETI_12175 [Halobacteriota archaeon]